DLATFESALRTDGTTNTMHRLVRRWELTNTRYLLGPAGFLDVLNERLDPAQHRFRILARFSVMPKPGVSHANLLEELTAAPNTNGEYGLFEFTGALPRALLYSSWQVSTNDQDTLQTLAATTFDPARTVLVSTPVSSPSAGGGTNLNRGGV